jgi:LuxR family maltose regulon positive regulatory protein
MQEALDLLPQGITAWLKPEVTLQQVRIGLAQGHLHEVEAVLNALGIDWRGPVLKELELYFLAYLHWMREKGRLKELSQEVKIADALVERSIQGERITIALQALLLRAQMHAQLNERSRALEDVSLALKLAESEGFIRTFVDAGPEIALLLKENLANRQRRDQPAAYIRQLLAAFSGNGRNAKDQGMIAQPPLIEALTEREMDVLRLITDGLEYKEIAERLVISLNTVRFYVKEIYSKLQVNNRSRAVETARKLGLL